MIVDEATVSQVFRIKKPAVPPRDGRGLRALALLAWVERRCSKLAFPHPVVESFSQKGAVKLITRRPFVGCGRCVARYTATLACLWSASVQARNRNCVRDRDIDKQAWPTALGAVA